MKKYLWIVIPLTLLVAACTREAENTESNPKVLKYLGEVVLSHGDLLLSNRSGLNKVVGEDSLLVYDQQSKQLVLLELQKKKPIHTIPVTLEGPDAFYPVFKDAEIRNDSLFILSRNFFGVYSLDGKSLMRFRTEDLQTNKISTFVYDFHLTDFELLDNNTVLFSKVPIDVIISNVQSEEKSHLFFTLDLPTGTITEIPVFSPKESLIDERDKGYYNDFAFHHMVSYQDSIIYSFAFTSKTFIYDMETKEQTEVETPFKSVENLRAPITAIDHANTKKSVEYIYSSSKFSGIERDNKTGFFVSIGSQFKKLANGEDRSTKYLLLLNTDFEVLEELEIKDGVFYDSVMISNGIIYLRKTEQPVEDAYTFVAYEIVK